MNPPCKNNLLEAIGGILNNTRKLSRIEPIQSSLTIQYTPSMWHLRGTEPLDATPKVNTSLRLRLHFQSPETYHSIQTVEVSTRPEMGGKEIEIEVLPSHEVVRDHTHAENLSQLFENLE
ncbi:hypothetical protein [Pajaroellobacter abortibovis]|uniref:Uncharacterized protein n=1 Tax=Pajaroellobacter abortibovis TaxID=1882918 RepID=A0A1L6MVV8_9BACT|nr:hypothetical protein [Pajaroellobacter abortibovis]APR99656.1 hypothetical protein BCY86_02425 [Pajaroellobacter abortibovis]